MEALTEARALGFLGPGPLEPQIEHARGFVAIARRQAGEHSTSNLVDLGSGGGLPGLVVATEWREATLALVEANGRRASFLRRAVERLGLGDRVSVLEERAEVCGRQPTIRSTFDAALARSFGRPAVVAECAAPLLKVEGWLVVSEPPRDTGDAADDWSPERWPVEPLRQFGLEPGEVVHLPYEYRTLRQTALCPERFPRRNGVPAKKPLF
jgi:16S rRNA (guanine527-N7)-methyltransferase